MTRHERKPHELDRPSDMPEDEWTRKQIALRKKVHSDHAARSARHQNNPQVKKGAE